MTDVPWPLRGVPHVLGDRGVANVPCRPVWRVTEVPWWPARRTLVRQIAGHRPAPACRLAPCSTLPMPSDPVDADLVLGLSAWVHDACRGFNASHDAEHAAQVHRLSELVLAADLPFASRDVQQAVRCAAWTHDLCDRKLVSDVPAAAAHVASTCRDLGASAAAAKLAGTVVATMSFSARLRRFDAAVAHSGSAEALTKWGDPPGMTEVELAVYRVVSDADLLEAMGTVGVVRTFMYQATHNATPFSALLHTKGTLQRGQGFLFHPWARTEGVRRDAIMREVCAEYRRERGALALAGVA